VKGLGALVLGLELAALSDEDLVARVKRREYPAFVTIFDRYRPNAVTFAVRMLADADEAEHVTHEAFVQVAKQATSFNPKKASFKTWFFAILRKLISKHALATRSSGVGGVARLENFSVLGHVADTSMAASRAEEVKALLESLGRLKPVYREVVFLRRFEKMGYDEIAKVCGEKPATVKSRMNYAVEQLRKGLHRKA
jgi:RNA polymerase sigma-70 factor (ECF subfamily)